MLGMKGQHAIATLVLLAVLAGTAPAVGNLLVDPSFEDWTKAWTRAGTHPGSAHWDSRWIKREDGYHGAYMMAVKHSAMEPFDDTTPVDVYFYQNLDEIEPGYYATSLLIRAGGQGDKWDGPGGADQWTQFVVYLWADRERTKLLQTVSSPKIEIPVPEWWRFVGGFKAGPEVRSVSFYACARLVDRYPRAWVSWDDAYLGVPLPEGVPPSYGSNILPHGSFDIPTLKPEFEIEGDESSIRLEGTGQTEGRKLLRIDLAKEGSAYGSKTIPLDCAEGFRRVRVEIGVKTENLKPGKQPWYGARMIVWFLDSEGKAFKRNGPERYDILPFVTGSHDWTGHARTIIVPQGTAKLKVQIGVDHASGTAWFGGATITEAFEDYLADEPSEVKIDVSDKTVSRMTEGFGWNWETVSTERHSALEVALWPELFERMAWDGPEMLRVAVMPGMCPPKEYVRGRDTGQHYTYDFDTPPIKHLCTLLEFCDKHGIDVLIANWHSGTEEYPGVPNGHWLRKGYYESTGDKNPDWLTPYSRDRMAGYLAELANYFRVTRGFKCVKYVSVWNEPGYWVDLDQYPEGILDIYRLLDTKLKAKGIRDLVKLLGLEMVEWGGVVHKTADAVRSAPCIDVAAVHNYGAGLACATATTSSWPLDEDLALMGPAIREFRSIRGGVPIMVTETNGSGTDLIVAPREQYLACLGAVEYAIELANRGIGAVLKWQYNQPGWSQFCPFRIEDQHVRPNGWTYYPWAMLTRWTVRGSGVLDTRVTPGSNSPGRGVRAAALRAPGGQVTVIVVSDGRLSKSVTLRVPAKPAGKWRQFVCDWEHCDGIREEKVTSGDGVLKATLPPESVSVFTTFEAGLAGNAP